MFAVLGSQSTVFGLLVCHSMPCFTRVLLYLEPPAKDLDANQHSPLLAHHASLQRFRF
jgi:hypothetical protein